jgi:hypothetical protein
VDQDEDGTCSDVSVHTQPDGDVAQLLSSQVASQSVASRRQDTRSCTHQEGPGTMRASTPHEMMPAVEPLTIPKQARPFFTKSSAEGDGKDQPTT